MKKPKFIFTNQWKDFFEGSVIHLVGVWFKLEICGFSIITIIVSRDGFGIGLLGFSLEVQLTDNWESPI